MKKLIFAIILSGISLVGFAQNKNDSLNRGKYFQNKNKHEFIGTWISNDPGKEIEFQIQMKKTRQKSKQLDYYTDAIFIRVKKYKYKGGDIAEKFINPLVLITTSPDSKMYTAIERDTITNNKIMMVLKLTGNETLVLNSKILPAYPGNDVDRGTVFYPEIKLKRKK